MMKPSVYWCIYFSLNKNYYFYLCIITLVSQKRLYTDKPLLIAQNIVTFISFTWSFTLVEKITDTTLNISFSTDNYNVKC